MNLPWDALAIITLVLIAWSGVMIVGLRMLGRYLGGLDRRLGSVEALEDQNARAIENLRAALRHHYVPREDWIRFSAQIDAKLDTLMALIRKENER